jgi:hypothetical protein
MDTVILRSPFFLDVNLTAFVIKFTSTMAVSLYRTIARMFSTLFHPVKIGNNVFDVFVIIRHIHGIVELDVFRFEFRLEDSESLRKFPLGAHLWAMSAGVVEREGQTYRAARVTASSNRV